MTDDTRKLVINQCPQHGYWAITVDDGSGGIRVTPGKCCGRWDAVKAFRLSARDWRELSELAAEAAELEEAR